MVHDHHHHSHDGCTHDGHDCGCSCDHGDDTLPVPQASPILVEETRGGMVEAIHRGRACVVDSAGHLLAQWGDVKAPVYPRSTVKAIQAIPLVESGAFDAYRLTDAELALACSSHHGESRHTRTVAAWLERIGCGVDDLECGPQVPTDEDTAAELIRQGEVPTALHNNCSGKHTGFLATARHLGERTAGYTRFDHPVQQRVMGVLEQLTAIDLSRHPWGVDGCNIPTFAIPLEALAFAMAQLGDPRSLPDRRIKAIERIRIAWAAHPHLIGGTTAFDTEMIKLANGQFLIKSGASGVGVAVLPRQGIGVALKIDDGDDRARDVAMANLLRSLETLSADHWNRAAHRLAPPIYNRSGREVGGVRVAEGWLAPAAED